jgi:hypothetical protein
MGINTRSSFYYIQEVTKDNNVANFNEGSGEIVANVPVGGRSIEQLMVLVQRTLTNAGSNTYIVDFDRITRLVTISADANFSLLPSSSGFSIFTFLGFESDQTGSDSYTATIPIGVEYVPQFRLQEFVAPEDNVENVSAKVNEAADGAVEVFSFGLRRFFEFNIKYINDYDRGKNQPIETNLNGVQETRDFLNFCIKKQPLEIMRDRDDKNSFETILLESTSGSRDGTGFKLREIRGTQGWYDTRKLKFRVVE